MTTKGQKKVRYRTSGNKSQITVVGCGDATGSCIPPFVIIDAKSLNMEWTKGEVPGTTYGLSDRGWIDMVLFKGWFENMEWTKGELPGTTYGLSDRGWIDMVLFKGWFENHFLKHCVSSRPILLLLDGHS